MRDDAMANGGVGESLLACATADVMLYEDTSKQWIRPDDLSTANSGAPNAQKLSNVQLIQDSSTKAVGFRIVAVRICDRKLLINQNIFPKLKYQAATTSFHQWRNEHRQVYGLSFSSEQDAGKFFSVVQQAMEFGNNQASSNDYHHSNIAQQQHQQHYSTANMNGENGNNGVYQDPHYCQQQSSGNNQYNDGDQESLGSSNGHTLTQQPISNAHQQQQAYRKSSYQVGPAVQPQPQHPHLHHHQPAVAAVGHLNSLVNVNIQRRASQGSNNSSNSSQPGQSIYASAHMPNNSYPHLQHQHSIGHAPPPAPPQPPTQGQALPPISTNAPPPPPPPPGGFKALNGSKATNFADQLKQTQLRKVSNGVGNGQSGPNTASLNRTSSSSGDTGIGSSSNSTVSSKTSTISSTNSGHSDLLSELAATINRRKNANGNGESKEAVVVAASSSSAHSNGADGAVEKKVNGETNNVFRPWQKTNHAANASSSTANNYNSVDSPKVHRKVPSGSSLSSQEDAANAGASSASKAISSSSSVATTVNGSNSPFTPATLADLERLKTELVTEFQRELQKSKQEILAALRQEFQQFYQQNR